LRILGLAQEGEGKLELARGTLERAFARSNASIPILVDLTRIAKTSKDYQGALGYLAHARELQPGNAEFAYEFGVLCIRMGLLAESRKAMQEAVKLSPYLQKYHEMRPSDPEVLLAIGTAYFRARNFDAASMWLRQAAEQASTAADAHYYLGRIARVQGHIDDAEHELELANTLSPNRSDILAELGQALIASHAYKEAKTYLDHAIAIDPQSYAANFAMLQLYARTGDPRREEQAKRFDEIKVKDEEHYQEMMRILEVRPE
jgi:tetratricopeptide (TPR) repeat protein